MLCLLDIYEEEKDCEYKGEIYSVRDNGAIMRHSPADKKPRKLDNIWTFGTIDRSCGYAKCAGEAVHRIVATAFLGEPPTSKHVVDHIDTNRLNNRPSNLRWVTRLENILLNDITRKKLELLCGCSIEEIMSDLSILHNKTLTPQFDWMRAVTKEEAEQSLVTWRKWTKEVTERKEYERKSSSFFRIRTGPGAMTYPLEPMGLEAGLEAYYDNLKVNQTFCYNHYYGELCSYRILDFCLSKNGKVLTVATKIDGGGIKSLYLTRVTFIDHTFLYDAQSFFAPESLEKYMTIARGEEWTGGDVFDDFC